MRGLIGGLAVCLFGGVLVSSALSGCDSATEETQGFRRRLLESWSATIALPAHRDFEARAQALEAAGAALCAGPDAERLDAARAAWWAARAPWKRTEVFAFGPYREEPLRIAPKVDFWPMRPAAVEAMLSGDAPVDAAAVATQGAATKGFPAIEYLLWQTDDPARFAGRRCAYLAGLTADLIARATQLRAAWDPAEGDYAGALARSGGGDGAFDTLQMAFAEVVNRMGYTLENIRFEKLGKPVGLDGGSPDASVVESPLSGRSLDDIRDNLGGIAALYHGGEGGIGLTDYLAFRGHAFDADFDRHLQTAYAALDAIEGPLATAVIERPAPVRAAIEALADLQIFIQVDIANALSVTLSFNDADGD